MRCLGKTSTMWQLMAWHDPESLWPSVQKTMGEVPHVTCIDGKISMGLWVYGASSKKGEGRKMESHELPKTSQEWVIWRMSFPFARVAFSGSTPAAQKWSLFQCGLHQKLNSMKHLETPSTLGKIIRTEQNPSVIFSFWLESPRNLGERSDWLLLTFRFGKPSSTIEVNLGPLLQRWSMLSTGSWSTVEILWNSEFQKENGMDRKRGSRPMIFWKTEIWQGLLNFPLRLCLLLFNSG